MKELRAFTVKAHWALLISAGLKTCENRSFRVPPGFYLVHASNSLSFSEWSAGSVWITERFGTAIICPSFDLCRSWCGQIVCGVRIVSALTASTDPWYLGDVAWELENPVPCAQGVVAKGALGVWPVSEGVKKRFERAKARTGSIRRLSGFET
ncbi:MAG TPA: hypothetical protein PLG22_14655 [Kiritimatiellia bacterium]|nr:hypothetical protein [Kiritimatiellia bacterium]